jgi:hypothetical protein
MPNMVINDDESCSGHRCASASRLSPSLMTPANDKSDLAAGAARYGHGDIHA